MQEPDALRTAAGSIRAGLVVEEDVDQERDPAAGRGEKENDRQPRITPDAEARRSGDSG